MATERQIAANRRNAERSTGPNTEEGKARSRGNATKHGLAAQLAEVEIEFSPEFVDRRERWSEGMPLADPAARWAMDRAVAASLRIERCERVFEGVIAASKERANLAWEEDREAEAGLLFERLGRHPVVASRQLRTTLAGVNLLIEAWLGLFAALERGSNWSAAEASRALDLLGVAPDLRSGRTVIDPFDETEPVTFRRVLALDEVEKLEILRDEAMVPLDEMDRRRALVGDVAVLSKSASLILRYERDAWRRYRQAMGEVHGDAIAADSAQKSRPKAEPRVTFAESADRAVVASVGDPERAIGSDSAKTSLLPAPDRSATPADAKPSFEEQRRVLKESAMPFVVPVVDRLRSMGLNDEDAWIEELERRVEGGSGGRGLTDRTQFAGRMTTGDLRAARPHPLDLTKR